MSIYLIARYRMGQAMCMDRAELMTILAATGDYGNDKDDDEHDRQDERELDRGLAARFASSRPLFGGWVGWH